MLVWLGPSAFAHQGLEVAAAAVVFLSLPLLSLFQVVSVYDDLEDSTQEEIMCVFEDI